MLDRAKLIRNLLDGFRVRLGDGATMLDAALAYHDYCCLSARQEWEATGNPIFAWRCIRRLHHLCLDVSVFCPELRGRRFAGPLPDWCEDWLIKQAENVSNLSLLQETDYVPQPGNIELADGPLLPQEAVARLPKALGFVRDGWNAFERYARDDYAALYVFTMELDKSCNRPSSFSVQGLMQEMGWTDERSARRKVAALRKRVKLIPLD